MRISDEGLQALERRENPPPDFSPCLNAYLDGKNTGTWTIGTGHTGPEVKEGVEWTPEQCRDALRKDLISTEALLQSTISPDDLALLSQNEYDSLVSFAFQLGGPNWRKSSVLKLINAGKLEQVPAAMALWKYANGDYSAPNAGVVNRRNSEIGQWSRGAFVSSASVDIAPPPSWWQQWHNRIIATGITGAFSGIGGDVLHQAGTELQGLSQYGHIFSTVGVSLIVLGIFWNMRKQA
jgi:lysozyme